ncbi:sulfatase, partial [Candidatus Omnitrophota bacterium]
HGSVSICMCKKKNIYFFVIIVISLIGIFIFLRRESAIVRQPVNIVLIVIDALRADHLGCYGYKRNTSPNIDNFAKEGVRFAQAITAAGWTVESLPSILTGTYSPTHQIRDWDDLRNDSIQTLAQLLSREGYECMFWSNHGCVIYSDIREGFQKVEIKKELHNDYPVVSDLALTEEIIEELESQCKKNNPFFWYIHYQGSHVPYLPPEPYKSMYIHDQCRDNLESVPISEFTSESTKLNKYYGHGVIPFVVADNNITDPNYYISQYDGSISYTDAQVGKLVSSLKKLELDKNTLVIVTADHGEMLGEHNIYFTHTTGYEENVRVPLIIRLPKLFPKGKIVSRQVSLVDLAPTILESAGLVFPFYMQGESLLALARTSQKYHKKYVYFFERKNSMLRSEDWKLIHHDRAWELYNLKDDPREQRNLIDENQHKFMELKQIFEDFITEITPPAPTKKGPPITEEDKERLRSLGYLQ